MTTRQESVRDERLKKLEKLKEKGVEPFAISTSEDRKMIADVLSQFPEDVEQGFTLDKLVTIAGRVRSLRIHGKIMFADLEDQSGRMQILLKSDELGKEQFDAFTELIDEGDFIESSGTMLVTRAGEKTIAANGFRVLTKSLLPIPSEYYGLKDVEERLRKRYLDLIANQETRELFRKKSIFWQSMRKFLLDAGFLEVETPVLESTPGGAEAEPFVTHHNALNRDFFLRISLELPLKRLLVGGYEKVFEIGRIFRNEGISAEHLQDYTQMEFYWAYSDYKNLMVFLQEMYRAVISQTFGTLKTTYQGIEIDWEPEWPVVDFYDVFEQYAGISAASSEKELKSFAKSKNIDIENVTGRGKILDNIYKKMVRPNLIQPQFLIRPPVEMEPLAKRDPEFPDRVQRLQIMAAGTELGKGFSELNDPLDQRARFEEQVKLREAGDKEAQRMDADYVEALEYGMPPASGFGVSERLFAVLVDKPIREVVFFPPMKEK
jgi:lysyl-tRNA synthetase, class II